MLRDVMGTLQLFNGTLKRIKEVPRANATRREVWVALSKRTAPDCGPVRG